MIRSTTDGGRRAAESSENPAPQKTKMGTPYKKKHPSCGQKIKPVCGIYVVNLKNEKISPKFRNFLREKPVTGFEPMAHRVDTLRAIRRRISMQEAAGSTKSSKTKNTADISSAVFFGPSDRI